MKTDTETTDPLEVSHEETLAFAIRLVVAGSRSYNDQEEFDKTMDALILGFDKANSVIISGDARKGADAMVIRWCKKRQWKYSRWPADWDQFGKRAGYMRNADMKEIATHVFVFWDLISKGSLHMLRISNADKAIKCTLVVVRPDEDDYTPRQEFNHGW